MSTPGSATPERHFHYRPWMGFGAWILGGVLAVLLRFAPLALAGVAAGFIMSQAWPWGPRVWKCWHGCGHE